MYRYGAPGRIHAFLDEGAGRNRLRMVLNRYKRIPGFTDEDVEHSTRCKVLWKIPNAYQAISPAIDHGTPVVLQESQEVSRSFRALAAALADASPTAEGGLDLVYAQEKTDSKKEISAGRLLIYARSRWPVATYRVASTVDKTSELRLRLALRRETTRTPHGFTRYSAPCTRY